MSQEIIDKRQLIEREIMSLYKINADDEFLKCLTEVFLDNTNC